MTNTERQSNLLNDCTRFWNFVIRYSSLFRHSDFIIRHCVQISNASPTFGTTGSAFVSLFTRAAQAAVSCSIGGQVL
jgi:hypothetical protein